MRSFSVPSFRHATISAIGSSSNQKLILENLYLTPLQNLVLSAKTVCKSEVAINQRLNITGSAKTVSLVVGVPNLVLNFAASAKTVSISTSIISNLLNFTASAKTVSKAEVSISEDTPPLNLELSAKTAYRVNLLINSLSISGSAKTVIRTNIILTTVSIAQRINKAKISMQDTSMYATLLPIFRT